MAKTEDGKILRSVKQIETGEKFSLQVNDGTMDAVVLHLKENET
jgi:exonuclease VII large subunit